MYVYSLLFCSTCDKISEKISKRKTAPPYYSIFHINLSETSFFFLGLLNNLLFILYETLFFLPLDCIMFFCHLATFSPSSSTPKNLEEERVENDPKMTHGCDSKHVDVSDSRSNPITGTRSHYFSPNETFWSQIKRHSDRAQTWRISDHQWFRGSRVVEEMAVKPPRFPGLRVSCCLFIYWTITSSCSGLKKGKCVFEISNFY